MSLTEVVFELADSQYPLCRFTREHRDVRAVFRIVDTGSSSGVFRATLTILGPTDVTNALVKDLRASKRYDEMEVLSITPYAVLLKLGHLMPGARNLIGVAVLPTERVLDAFGNDTILEPLVVEEGRIRVRCLVPQVMETKRVLMKLQEIQRGMEWEHFRVIRVAEFKALRYANVLRRLLTPEQEELLRLALSLGYYDSPKGCTLEDIARRVGLSVSPVHKKLKNMEQVLINAHVEPSKAQPPNVRRRSRDGYGVLLRNAAIGPGSMCEVSLRVRWASYAPLVFTSRHPGSRVIFQHLQDDLKLGTASSFVVIAASENNYRELVGHYERHPSVQGVEVTAKASDHVTLKLRSALLNGDEWRESPDPFAHLAQRFGRDAYMKPVVIEAEDMWVRFIVVRGLSNDDILHRVDLAAKEAGWDEFEVLSLRRVDVDSAVAPVPQPEKMTARQEEVLKIAHALGYYKTPRECTLEGVAQTLGISANAIHKNLTAAEQKIILNYLSAGI